MSADCTTVVRDDDDDEDDDDDADEEEEDVEVAGSEAVTRWYLPSGAADGVRK